MLEGQPAVLNTRTVKYDELMRTLPAETVMVSAAERTAAMWERFNAIRRRYVL